ncbi:MULTISPECIES: PTS sugar transporter [Lactobacillaceae]|uniref:PTS sugar transporter n=1 Tax=Lactobacillaceae TaxID=33958 RepID=UPI0014573859|nr:PTS sugar transporter [Lactobacillus sp. HBUAS51381]NLR10241.1 PTS sugar transporter [Lactobacillus sp. HBUAS51381]
MKTIGFSLFEELPTIDETAAFQKICQKHTGKVTIKVRDIEIDPSQHEEIVGITDYAGHYVRVVAEGPDEALLAGAIHQQLAADKCCY